MTEVTLFIQIERESLRRGGKRAGRGLNWFSTEPRPGGGKWKTYDGVSWKVRGREFPACHLQHWVPWTATGEKGVALHIGGSRSQTEDRGGDDHRYENRGNQQFVHSENLPTPTSLILPRSG